MANAQKPLLLVFLLLGLYGFSQNPRENIQQGEQLLAQGEYQRAVTHFQKVLLDQNASSFHGKATLGMGKVFLATGNLTEAEGFLESFVENFPQDTAYEEGLYHRARLYIFQGEYESSLIALNDFLSAYPQTNQASNALFWAGESAFRLGYLDEATSLFKRVIQGYPQSSKIEAIQYRLSLIGLLRREKDLIRLLRWSHEENIFNLSEFRKREESYKQALASYQEELASWEEGNPGRGPGTEALEDQLREKDRIIASLTAQIGGDASIDGPITGVALENQDRLLSLKERALKLQIQLIRWKLGQEAQ